MKTAVSISILLFAIKSFTYAQQVVSHSTPLIGEDAPSFIAESTIGTFNFPGDFGKSWKILFSHPADFTPVCTSEILELALMQKEFNELNTKIAVISTDELTLHKSWVKSMDELISKENKNIKINFPLIDDSKEEVSKRYGMVTPAVDPKRTVRGVFIIDPQNKIAAYFFYPKNVGRNLEEIKRTVIALQTAQNHTVLTPVNWKPGDDVLLPYPYPYNYYDTINDKEDGYYNLSWYMLFKKLKITE
jgi:peroxiredoxin 2/4